MVVLLNAGCRLWDPHLAPCEPSCTLNTPARSVRACSQRGSVLVLKPCLLGVLSAPCPLPLPPAASSTNTSSLSLGARGLCRSVNYQICDTLKRILTATKSGSPPFHKYLMTILLLTLIFGTWVSCMDFIVQGIYGKLIFCLTLFLPRLPPPFLSFSSDKSNISPRVISNFLILMSGVSLQRFSLGASDSLPWQTWLLWFSG